MSQDSFLESLRTYLHRLNEAPTSGEGSETEVIDSTWARNLLLRILERLDAGEAGVESFNAAMAPYKVTEYLEEWQAGARIVVFVRELDRLLRRGMAASLPREGRMALIELGLARWFELPGELPSRIQAYELDRLVKEARTLAWQSSSVFVGLDVVRYAAVNQLTLRKGGKTSVSPIGEVFEHLQGRDAVRWLLHVESQLAVGESDPDRLSRQAAARVLAQISWPYDGDVTPCHQKTALRLSAMGILMASEFPGVGAPIDLWEITLLGRDLLGELLQSDKTPLTLLAESLCSDLVSSAVRAVGGSNTGIRSSAAEATASQARMVAHEIRNALLPVQAALDSLYKELQVLSPIEALHRRRPVIDGGIKGALRFTKDLLQTAELGARPPERFEPLHAVSEVVAELSGTNHIVISPPAAVALPLLLGRREHFVLAVRSLIENAIQHGGARLHHVSVEMALEARGEGVLLTIDDDGQGVSEVERDRIFQEGYSNKPGGTGFGLSWVKRVIEEELRGVVVCTQAPLGGARFAVRLPSATVGPTLSLSNKEPG